MRRNTAKTYQASLGGLANASGIDTPTPEGLARLDRKRRKKTSHKNCTKPTHPDAMVTKMKDGRTHLAHRAEHAVGLETARDCRRDAAGRRRRRHATIVQTATAAADQIASKWRRPRSRTGRQALEEIIADKGYHSNQTMVDLETVGQRSYIAEPDRGRRDWSQEPDARASVYRSRRRIRGPRGRRSMRRRDETIELSFTPVYDTGGTRRTHPRGQTTS